MISEFILKFGVVLTLLASLVFGGSVGAAPSQDPNARIVINIPSRTLWLYSGDKIVKYYPVGVGRRGFSTPVGKHKVVRMVKNPTWENPYKAAGAVRIRPGSGNPLGTRWIGFKPYKGGEYGIHGTDNPSSVGRFSSHGCVRMKTKDAEDLFNRVTMGTPVEVIYDLALIRPKGNDIRVVVYPDVFNKGMPSVNALKERIQQEYPHSKIDMAALAKALQHPTQKPVLVARISEPVEGEFVQKPPVEREVKHENRNAPPLARPVEKPLASTEAKPLMMPEYSPMPIEDPVAPSLQ